MSQTWIIRVILVVIALLLIAGPSIYRNAGKFNTGNLQLPSWNWRIVGATLAGILVLCLILATDPTVDFLQMILFSRLFWGLFLTALVFWSIYQDDWSWFWTIAGTVFVVWIILLIIGRVWPDDSKPDSAGKPTVTTKKVYRPGDIIFSGSTPCSPVIPRGYDLTPTGPIKMVFQTESGPATRRIREEAEAPPSDRIYNRPVVITSLTPGVEYRVIIIAR